MADLRSKQLPNLKISVDNTESTDESSDEVEIREETEISFHDDDVELSEESGEEEEIDKNEVEFNVRIGSSSFSDPKQKQPRDRDDSSYLKSKKPDSATQDTKTSIRTTKRLPQIPEKRVYENKQGGFVTGIDVTSKEAEKKRLERAKRFRIQQEKDEQFSLDVKALYDSLGVKTEDFENEEKGLRNDTVHVRGTDEMSTSDVFDYFSQFPASEIEWINDTSCNVVWRDKVTCIRALLKVSCSYKEAVATESKKKKEQREKEEQERKEEKQRRKQAEISVKEIKVEKMDDQDDTRSADASSGDASGGQDQTKAPEEEQMEVDDDELDLMVENEDVDLSKVVAADPGKGDNKATPEEEESGAVASSKDSDKVSEKEQSRKKTLAAKKAKETAQEKAGSDKVKDGKKVVKKKDKKEQDKEKKKEQQKKKEREEGADSDSSSSSSSSSGSSSGSSSDSSSSSSDSDSSSSSDSNSSSSSSSDSESEDDSKKKKGQKSSRKSKQDKDPEEITQKRQQRKEHTIPWPPGKWRLGQACKKARYIFMRFATKYDKKEVGAEKRSQYYRKYGNPNYGGMKGLISSSRKRKILFAKLDKEIKSQGPDAREAIDKKRANRQRQQKEDREEGELSNEELMEPERELLSEEEAEEPAVVVEKPKDLRQLLNRDAGSTQSSRRPERSMDQVVIGKRRRHMEEEDSSEELDLDAELEQLMEPRPAKKRMTMRMHADEEEERIKARRTHTGRGLLTVTASSKATGVQSRLGGRLGGRLQLPTRQRTSADFSGDGRRQGHVWNSEAKLLNSEDDDDDVEDVEEMDDFARELESYRSLRNIPPLKSSRLAASKVSGTKGTLTADSLSEGGGGGDLRSRLGTQKAGKDSEKQNFPSMRIEVFDDDDDEDQ